jgi:hypothetical protein
MPSFFKCCTESINTPPDSPVLPLSLGPDVDLAMIKRKYKAPKILQGKTLKRRLIQKGIYVPKMLVLEMIVSEDSNTNQEPVS